MRKIIYLAVTYMICAVMGLGNIWLWFTPVLLSMLLFKIPNSIWWEIPIACLSFNILELLFEDDLKALLHILILCSTVIISVISPRRLFVFFLIAIAAMYFENIFTAAAVWATLWYGLRSALTHFTIKKVNLQE